MFSFEAIKNSGRSNCFRLEQRSVIKSLMVKMCKPSKICIRMCNMGGELYLDQKIFTNRLNMGLPLQAWVKKQSIESKLTDSPVKKKFWSQQSIKKVMLTVFLDIKVPITNDFFEKSATVNAALHCQFLQQLVNCLTVVKGNMKTQFSIASTPRCRGRHYSFSWIAPLYPWSIPYNADF